MARTKAIDTLVLRAKSKRGNALIKPLMVAIEECV